MKNSKISANYNWTLMAGLQARFWTGGWSPLPTLQIKASTPSPAYGNDSFTNSYNNVLQQPTIFFLLIISPLNKL